MKLLHDTFVSDARETFIHRRHFIAELEELYLLGIPSINLQYKSFNKTHVTVLGWITITIIRSWLWLTMKICKFGRYQLERLTQFFLCVKIGAVNVKLLTKANCNTDVGMNGTLEQFYLLLYGTSFIINCVFFEPLELTDDFSCFLPVFIWQVKKMTKQYKVFYSKWLLFLLCLFFISI